MTSHRRAAPYWELPFGYYPIPEALLCQGHDSHGEPCCEVGTNRCPRCGKLFCDGHFDSEGYCFWDVPTMRERLGRQGEVEYQEWLLEVD